MKEANPAAAQRRCAQVAAWDEEVDAAGRRRAGGMTEGGPRGT